MTTTAGATIYESDVVDASPEELRAEVARLRKTVDVLMDRVEQSAGQETTEFGLFQTALVLEDLVERRTEELRTALKRNERIMRVLRDSEERFRGLAEQSLAGIAIIEGTRFVYVNGRFADTFGYDRIDMLSVDAIEIVAHSSRLRVARHLSDTLADKTRPQLLEFEASRQDGSTIHVELSSSRMEMGGRLYAICVTTDISARKLAERKVQALNRRLSELAVRDPLTGLYNRRFMEASLEREIIAAERNGTPLSLVLCDVDHFKAVNDTFGHQTGDEVLKAFGSLLKRGCRRSDIACRYGGEEFLVVFPGMPAEVAATWAEKARTALAETRVGKGATRIRVSASFGVASYPADADTWQHLISAADRAQYQAKAAGRNRVIAASTVDADETADAVEVADPAMLLARAG